MKVEEYLIEEATQKGYTLIIDDVYLVTREEAQIAQRNWKRRLPWKETDLTTAPYWLLTKDWATAIQGKEQLYQLLERVFINNGVDHDSI